MIIELAIGASIVYVAYRIFRNNPNPNIEKKNSYDTYSNIKYENSYNPYQNIYCNKCSMEFSNGYLYCKHCGADLRHYQEHLDALTTVYQCRNCGIYFRTPAKYCRKCGGQISKTNLYEAKNH